VGVWSCFCRDEIGPFYIFPDGENITARRYYWVLKTLFVLFYNKMRAKYKDKVVMQQDNAPWDTAKIIKNYMRNKKI
jgi:hypothetical protein